MNQLPSVTLEQFLDRAPCWNQTRIRAIADRYRRKSWTALEVLALTEVPAEDRLWVVLHESMLPSVVQRRFAVEVAADAMRLTRHTDQRSWAALDAAMAFERGEIGDAARDAARDAAWDAALGAALGAARAAAGAAALGAARDAAGDAAGDAAWDAAGDAARAAARAAAWGAARARAAQIRTLTQITLRWLSGEDIASGGPWKRPEGWLPGITNPRHRAERESDIDTIRRIMNHLESVELTEP